MDVPSKVAAVFVGVGLAVSTVAISAEFLDQHSADHVRFRAVSIPDRPCASEDGPAPCFWDAGIHGDGRGNSFWLTRTGERVHIHFLDPRVKERPIYGGCDEAAQPGNPTPEACR